MEVLNRIPNHSAEFALPNREVVPEIWEPNFVRLLHEVDLIYSGSGQDLSKGALYWADTRRIETPFFKEKILGNPEHPRVADMNSLGFWR